MNVKGKGISWPWAGIIRIKRKRVNNAIFPFIFKLLERLTSWEKGKGAEISGKKIKIKKMGFGENIML